MFPFVPGLIIFSLSRFQEQALKNPNASNTWVRWSSILLQGLSYWLLSLRVFGG